MQLDYLHRKSSLPANENRPLLILLHGYGSNEADLFSFAEDVPKEYEIISYRAPRETPMGGFCWYDINFVNTEKFNDTVQAKESIALILKDTLALCQQLNGIENNITLCGFSQGAILSYALVLQHPNIFKKIACLSGYPDQEIIGNLKPNPLYAELDFFISHGQEDAVIPVEWGRNGKELLDTYNISYQYKEYYAGHGLNPNNYKDLMFFLKQN